MIRPSSTDRSTIRLFWQATMLHKRLFFQSLLNPVGSMLLGTVAPLFVGKILAALVLPGGQAAQYLPYFVGAAMLGLVAHRFGSVWLLRLQTNVMSTLQAQALEALLRRSVGFHSNNVGGKLVSDARDFPNAFERLSYAALTSLLPLGVVLVTGSILVFLESWMLGLVIVAMVAFAFISGIRESVRRKPIRLRRLDAIKAATSHMSDTILNAQTVKAFVQEKTEMRLHHRLSSDLLSLRLDDWTAGARVASNNMIALTFMQIVFIVVVIQIIQNNPALLGIGIFAFAFTITVSNRLFETHTMIRSIEEGLLQAAPMTKIILEEPEIRDKRGAKRLHVVKGAISMHDVRFRYQGRHNQEIFCKLNLDVAPGEKVGIVGPSGGGKTTLTRLLLRFEDIDEGQILIDNQDITTVTQASLRRAIAYVPQEPLLFHRTIRENIVYGERGATVAAMKRAARLARAHEFIQLLPDSYNTIVGERGVKLSGGQRQRIAIARAILQDAPILILDEATSALDSESEALIQEALQDLMKQRTALVIAHRLSTIQNMDRIIVLQDGNIVEEGSHEKLRDQQGLYAKLWARQSGGFLEA